LITVLRIICHGGAGPLSPAFDAKNAVVRRAAEVGMEILRDGGAAVDAVVAAVSYMEDDPLLNAGTGSYVQLDGQVRMDASVMDNEFNVGVVIGIHDVRNPVRVARRLMEESIHSVLYGDLATQFARSEGFSAYDPRTEERLELWLELRRKYARATRLDLVREMRDAVRRQESLGTVGCVAFDDHARLAAATSTGGLKLDMPGRVGDVPLVGCGTYANPHAAVSCTGIGEYIIKVCLAKTVVDYVRAGNSAAEACRLGLEEMAAVGGTGGLICIDRDGQVGRVFNTEGMTFCALSHD